MSDKKEEEIAAEGENAAIEVPDPTEVSYIFPNGDKYEGGCYRSASGDLVRNGTGKHTSANGTIYMGEWCDDKMKGKGVLKHPTGARYEGELDDNMYHGFGTYTFPDGSKYTGQFQENRLEGKGTFVDANAQIWTGTFQGEEALGLKLYFSVKTEPNPFDF